MSLQPSPARDPHLHFLLLLLCDTVLRLGLNGDRERGAKRNSHVDQKHKMHNCPTGVAAQGCGGCNMCADTGRNVCNVKLSQTEHVPADGPPRGPLLGWYGVPAEARLRVVLAAVLIKHATCRMAHDHLGALFCVTAGRSNPGPLNPVRSP